MSRFSQCVVIGIGMLLLSTLPALATDHIVSIDRIKIVNDGSYDMVVVTGSFSPALPCAKQGFWIYPTESKYKEIYALLIAAKLSGSQVEFTHVYCFENGYSRGNVFSLL